MALIYFAAALGVILISYEIIKALSGDASKIMRWFRLRRRGHRFAQFKLSLILAWPKFLCAIGRHDTSHVKHAQVGFTTDAVRGCHRWFCSKFGKIAEHASH